MTLLIKKNYVYVKKNTISISCFHILQPTMILLFMVSMYDSSFTVYLNLGASAATTAISIEKLFTYAMRRSHAFIRSHVPYSPEE